MRNLRNFPSLIGLIVLAAVLCSCSFGGRPLTPTETPSQPAAAPTTGVKIVPSATAGIASPSVTPPAAATQAVRATATLLSATADASGQNLLNQINALNAANQAGDALEDLP
jgi:hypothetical protein